jgi:hypothetical protein
MNENRIAIPEVVADPRIAQLETENAALRSALLGMAYTVSSRDESPCFCSERDRRLARFHWSHCVAAREALGYTEHPERSY